MSHFRYLSVCPRLLARSARAQAMASIVLLLFAGTVSAADPFSLTCFTDGTATVTTALTCTTPPLSGTKKFQVLYISGQCVIGDPDVVDMIEVRMGNQALYIPYQFISRPLNFGGNFGVGRMFQFSTPVDKVLVNPGEEISLRCDGNSVGRVLLSVVGTVPGP